LKASLEGAAGQILWTAGNNTSVAKLLEMLRSRFGSANQAERFRAELRARKRWSKESLQNHCQDVCRLLSLASPDPPSGLSDVDSELSNVVGRDSFLEALNNRTLRVRLLEKEPRTLEEALSIACRLEAFHKVGDGDNSGKNAATRARINMFEQQKTMLIRSIA